MRIDFSKEFAKAFDKLSGKIYESVRDAIHNVIEAQSLDEIQNCKKIETLNSVYRIRIGSKRAFFVLHIEIEGDLAKFEYLLNRGEAYDKKNMERLRRRDV